MREIRLGVKAQALPGPSPATCLASRPCPYDLSDLRSLSSSQRAAREQGRFSAR
jgi:hypothetical protein